MRVVPAPLFGIGCSPPTETPLENAELFFIHPCITQRQVVERDAYNYKGEVAKGIVYNSASLFYIKGVLGWSCQSQKPVRNFGNTCKTYPTQVEIETRFPVAVWQPFTATKKQGQRTSSRRLNAERRPSIRPSTSTFANDRDVPETSSESTAIMRSRCKHPRPNMQSG